MLIALTGGIGSGKTTVARIWVTLGATEIDADVLARKVVQPGSDGLNQVVEEFGVDILNEDGSLNRTALGKIIFKSPDLRLKLEQITHPLIQGLAKQIIASTQGPIVYTIPLLVETNSPLQFDSIVTVSAPEKIRVQRLVAERGMSEKDARSRISAQVTDQEREAVADHVIDSNCTLEDLSIRATAVFQAIVEDTQE